MSGGQSTDKRLEDPKKQRRRMMNVAAARRSRKNARDSRIRLEAEVKLMRAQIVELSEKILRMHEMSVRDASMCDVPMRDVPMRNPHADGAKQRDLDAPASPFLISDELSRVVDDLLYGT